MAITWMDGDKVKEQLSEISYNMPEVLQTYKGVRLNSREKSELQKFLKMGTLRRDLELVMNNPRWRREVDEYKSRGLRVADGYNVMDQRFYQEVHKVFVRAKKVAIQEMLANNPEVAKRILERAQKKIISKTGSYHSIDYLINGFPK